MKKFLGGIAAVALLAAFAAAPRANADQIYVCQKCTAPPGGDPNVITNTGSFNVGVAGSATLQNPLLIIVGVYNGSGTPSINFGGSASMAALGTYGLTGNGISFTSGDAFTALGLSAGGSESFVNWSGADVSAGFAAPTSFTLYAFVLNTALTSSPITISESGAANGSFILAYGCKSGTAPVSETTGLPGACDGGDVAQTVFTNTGLVDGATPEPSSLLLLGTGLIGLGAAVRRRMAL